MKNKIIRLNNNNNHVTNLKKTDGNHTFQKTAEIKRQTGL